jgi:class 3 adenylate cyclase
MRQLFDPAAYRIVLFDQRGAGRSRPHASDAHSDLSTNTTPHLIADLERLRTHLRIGRWLLLGISWGSTLAVAYAEEHPDRVTEVVLAPVTLTRRSDVEWFTRGAGRFFPEQWERFLAELPADRRDGDLADAYAELLTARNQRGARAPPSRGAIWWRPKQTSGPAWPLSASRPSSPSITGSKEHAWRQSAVEYVEGALERAGLYSPLHRPPAICFLDMTGYTRLTEERGDEAAADLATKLATLVRRSSQDHGGQPVKWLGDGVMFYFREAGGAVLAALDMVEGVANHDLPPAHVELHAGPVVFQDGDYFGRTVNLAARIADYARPGEVVVSQEVVDAADAAPVSFVEIGPVELKGVTGTLRLHTARRDA